jgi:hypothetical protein
MAFFLVVAGGTAMAEEVQIDQEWATHDTVAGITQYGAFQTSRAGITGTVGKVAVLVGCCVGTDAPAGDLRMTVSGGDESFTTTISKETFTNDDVLRWEEVSLESPIPVQGGSTPSDVSINLKNTSGTSQYLWALDTKSSGGTKGGYDRGRFWGCYVEWRGAIECDPSTADANFRTYVTPGPDLVPPQTYLPTADGGFLNGPSEGSISPSARVLFKFYAYENGYAAGSGITFECKMDGGSWETCTSPKEYNGLSEGSHTFQVRAIDPYGNVDPTPESRQWFVDTTPPDTTITSHPPEQSDDSTASFEFSSNEPTSSVYGPFECKLDDDSWISCSSPKGYGGLSEGSYTFQVRAVDQFNRRDPTPATYTWTYTDTAAPPSPSITSPTEGSILKARSFTISGTAEANSTVELFEGSTSKGTAQVDPYGQWNIPLSDVVEGSHTYTAKATDAAGNTSAESSSRTMIVDATAPAAPVIDSPANDSFDRDGNITLSGTAEEGSTVEVFDGATPKGTTPPVGSSGAWSMTLNGVGEGAHTYTAKATDVANNISGSSDPITVKVDTTKPTVIGTTPLNRGANVGLSTNLTATFSEKMRTTSISKTTFKLYKVNSDGTQTQITNVAVSLSPDGLKATLNPFGVQTPTLLLARNTKYKGVVTTGAKDLAGNSLAQQKSWTFTTKP